MNGLALLGILALAASLFACRAFQLDAGRERQRAAHLLALIEIAHYQRDLARAERDKATEHAEHATRTLRALLSDDRPVLTVVDGEMA